MIDTVVLTIDSRKFHSLVSREDGLDWDLHSKSGAYRKYVKNQNERQKKDGVYRPRVREIQRNKAKTLQMEFSIPKLMYGNNLEEVEETDFDSILERLGNRLMDFGVAVSEKVLREATVSAVHFSKNIVLSDGYTASQVIRELGKINLTEKMDLTKERFSNGGQSVQLYANSNSFVIYDKVSDLNKPKKRAIDKDQTSKQFSLFKEVKERKEPMEILRLEIRIANRRKLNSILRGIGHEEKTTFADIFKKEVSRKIVTAYWERLVTNENIFLFRLINGPQDTLRDLVKRNPNLQTRKLIYLVGLGLLTRDKEGIVGLRKLIGGSERAWYRITDEFKLLRSDNPDSYHDWVRQVSVQLDSYEPFRYRIG